MHSRNFHLQTRRIYRKNSEITLNFRNFSFLWRFLFTLKSEAAWKTEEWIRKIALEQSSFLLFMSWKIPGEESFSCSSTAKLCSTLFIFTLFFFGGGKENLEVVCRRERDESYEWTFFNVEKSEQKCFPKAQQRAAEFFF